MYALGIDLGTTFTGAALWRDGQVEVAPLGTRTAVVPSVVLAREDGTFLTGEAASRRGLTEPHRVAREFKRRLGDTTPILLGGSPYPAHGLLAELLRAVVDRVAQREGGPAARICLTYPANWGAYKQDLLARAVRLAELDQPVTYTTEPQAAAVFYAHQQRIDPGAMVAVYDLGGGTFDAAVLRKTTGGFELIGRPEGIERLGGIDFDAAVFAHVQRTLGGALAELAEDDPAVVAAVARLREECTAAKEALSADTDVAIPVLLPSGASQVRLTRAELEAMIRPSLHSTVDALRHALRTANVSPEQLQAVLLVGGASRMPIVAQLVGAELGRPVAVDAHPKYAVAQGAARLAAGLPELRSSTDTTVLPAPPVGPASPAAPPAPAAPPPGARAGLPATARLPALPRSPAPTGRAVVPAAAPASAPPALVATGPRRRWPLLAATATVLALLGAAGAYAFAARGDPDPTIPVGGGSTRDAPASAAPAGHTRPPPTAPPDSNPPPASIASTAPPEDETVTIDVWFVRDGTLVSTTRTRPFTLATSRLALSELIAGPTPEEAGEGIGNAIPGDLPFDVRISDGIAIVELPPSFFEADVGVARMRQAQVVYTLTEFPTVSAILFQSAGEPLPPLATRDDYGDLAP